MFPRDWLRTTQVEKWAEKEQSGAGFLTTQNDSHLSSQWPALLAGQNQNKCVSTRTESLTPRKCHMDEFLRLLWKDVSCLCPICRLVQLPGQWYTLPPGSCVVLAWLRTQRTPFPDAEGLGSIRVGAFQATCKQAPKVFHSGNLCLASLKSCLK